MPETDANKKAISLKPLEEQEVIAGLFKTKLPPKDGKPAKPAKTK